MGATRRKRPDIDSNALLEFLKRVESYTEDLIYGVPAGEGLYHYTDLAGLQGILSSSDIWLTNSRYSNDGEEMTHGYRVASEVIDEEFEAAKAGGQLDRATYVKSVRELLATPPAEGVYICCFCLSGNLLSQWRGYGGNGCGVSIKFDPHGFASVTGPDSPSRGLLRLWKVFYDPKAQRSIVQSALNFGFTQPALPEDRARYAADAITFFIPTFKNEDFSEERECRLIFTPPPSIAVRPRFRVARGMLIPYFSMRDLTGGSQLHLPIEGIVVGPMPHKDLNVASIEALLTAGGYPELSVDRSSTPYRA